MSKSLLRILVIVTWINSISPSVKCVDKHENCPVWKKQNLCQISRYKGYMKKNCTMSCGFCSPSVKCVDKHENCPVWKKQNFCQISKYKDYMKKNCIMSCGFCDKPQPQITQIKLPKIGDSLTCGKDRTNNTKDDTDEYIVDGWDAKAHSWPWQARINVKDKKFQCGGTLIAPRIVLTAAHCFYRYNKFRKELRGRFKKKDLYVTLGDHKRNMKDGPEQVFKVSDYIRHEDYVSKGNHNDIAVIVLDKPADLDKHVNLPCFPHANADVDPKSECYITGWGKTVGMVQSSLSNVLQEAKLPIVPNSECSKRNIDHKTKKSLIMPNMLCAGTKNGTTSGCQGDSGGPFVCRSTRTGQWVLQGAVSWGHYACENVEKYTVFARVSKYIKWIEEVFP